MTDLLPYGRHSIDEQDVAAVVDALRAPLLTQGPRVESFERAFAEQVGARHAVAFSSGTAALHAAAHAAGIGPGDELLTSPLSFVASASCALYVGARPLFADVDPLTANIDLRQACEHGLPGGARACVAVSLAGLPVDMRPLREPRRAGLVAIEDACHALGALREGRPVGGGGQADMTAFSLHPVKAITSGEGGMVSTDDDGLAESLRSFRTHCIRRREDAGDVMRGGWHYEIDALGFNYRISDFQCALGLSQLARLEDFVATRNGIAERYRELLGGCEQLQLPAEPPPGSRHAYHLFVVRFREGPARRRQVYERLRERGIVTQLHYIPIPVHSLYRRLGYTMEELPNAQSYYEQALSLPIFPALRDADVVRVVAELKQALQMPLADATASEDSAADAKAGVAAR